jgi:hypothetical protein
MAATRIERRVRNAIEIPGAGQLRISQHLVRDDVFGVFRDALDAGAVAPDSVLGRTVAPSKVAATRAVIQDCVGQTAARATLYYTVPVAPLSAIPRIPSNACFRSCRKS